MLPNQSQEETLEDWLVTLRKHRNYALRERIEGFDTNNKDMYCLRSSHLKNVNQ